MNEKVTLRPMTVEDTDLIVSWRNQEEVRKYFICQDPFTREGHLNWIRTMVDTGKVVQMMICVGEDSLPVGSVNVRDIDRQNQKGEYGIFIGESSARGKGIGTEAAKLMLRHCFKELQLHRVFLRVYADNFRAIRSYEKAGFQKEAYLRDDVFVNGKFRDIILMAALNQQG